MVITAGHCDEQNWKFVNFKEQGIGGAPGFTVALDDCERPMGGNETGQTYGIDLMVCQLDPTAPGSDKLPNVPPLYPMVPTGPIRDHLAHEVYSVHKCMNGDPWGPKDCIDPPGPDVTIVGRGGDNTKRFAEVMLVEQIRYLKDGSKTKLRLNLSRNSKGELPGQTSVMVSGDSGGPMAYRIRDGSWRLLSAHHGSGGSAGYAEAIPPYLHWLEDFAGDITPCHELEQDAWVWKGNCEGSYALNLHESYDDWGSECAENVAWGGGHNEHGTSWMPTPEDYAPPSGFGNHKIAPVWIFQEMLPGVALMVQEGHFSDLIGRIDEQAVRDFFYDGADPYSAFPFLAPPPDDWGELRDLAAQYAWKALHPQ
ncbi:MAG: hypothetical protein HC927_09910 [Deltaproteobacteria bacterium]|nr:hypothetical protein [Deltaproteobacteria bacterium]